MKLGAATIIDVTTIEVDGERYTASRGDITGVYRVVGDWLRDGRPQETVSVQGNIWHRPGCNLAPTSGWTPTTATRIPYPATVRQAVTGEPLAACNRGPSSYDCADGLEPYGRFRASCACECHRVAALLT